MISRSNSFNFRDFAKKNLSYNVIFKQEVKLQQERAISHNHHQETRFSKVPAIFQPGELFNVCQVCIQGQSQNNNIENGNLKQSVKEAKLTGM